MTEPGIPATIAVLDYGSGNVHSVVKALEAAGARATLTSDRRRVYEADGLVVPGVGAFGAVMTALTSVGGDEMIDRRLAGGRGVLGICVGMQVLFERGLEHGHDIAGLGQWPGAVEQLHAPVLPHMGWNTITASEDSALFRGVRDQRFFFVHSYATKDWVLPAGGALPAASVTRAHYGEPFLAAVENGPLSATQFHPEKSAEAGITLLSNWLGTL